MIRTGELAVDITRTPGKSRAKIEYSSLASPIGSISSFITKRQQ
jgi:hypothetical protein